ncbi:MAG: terminase large subunit domain-containing protein [Halovenus sp.]
MSDEVDADEQQRILQTVWRPHPGQRAIMDHPARFRIVACGRRWGKSEMAAHAALERALEEPNTTVWWVAPSYDQANSYGFDKMIPLLSPDIVSGDPKRTKPREIEFVTGSTISFRSAEREDSLRGPGLDFLIIDEAGSVPERAWTEELRPALSDTLGDMLAIGTPRGRNWFYRWFQRGQSEDHDDVASWQAPTYQNPHVPDDEIDDAKDDIPERKFEQEYLAQFVDDTGGVFKDVRDHVGDYDLPVDAADEMAYAIGVDFARLEDYTAIVVLDGGGQLVAFDRLNETTWHRIQARIEDLAETYTPHLIAVDATRDNKIVADLEAAGLPVDPINFGQKKQVLIDNLATRLEAGDLTLSADAPVLVNELEVFEYDITDAGTVRYQAPSGFHDDTVDALALATHQLPRVSGFVDRQQQRQDSGGSGVTYL